jgi:hypothetical protein
MSAVKERLGRLLTLASEGRWTALAGELADLALDWPADFPQAMRVPVMALLEWTAREADEATRALLAARVGGHPELPLKLLNELYLAAPARVRREILMRDELDGSADEETAPADTEPLLAAARQEGLHDFASTMSTAFAIPRRIAEAIMADASGEPLAVLCRGTGTDRATFTSLALLKGVEAMSLAVFDTVPEHAARRLAGHWRAHAEQSYSEHVQAAE